MALLTSAGISQLSVPLLTRMLTLPMTVARIPQNEFRGDNGSTIKVKVRGTRTGRKQTTPGGSLTYDALSETSVSVTVYHLYDGAPLTDYDLTLNLRDFGSQVARPQLASVATIAEDELGTAMNDVASDDLFATTTANIGTDSGIAETKWHILQAQEALSDADVPMSDRYLACSPAAYTRVLHVKEFTKANEAGSDSALRRAIMGDLYGFTVVMSNALEAGSMVAYHESGFVFATATPVAPRGATDSSATTSQGIGIRHIFDYDSDTATDRSLMSTFGGAALVDSDRVYKVGEVS